MTQILMDAIDRKAAPPVNEVKKAEIKQVSELRLKNNIPVYFINAGTQDLVKIELIFPAGMWQQQVPLMSASASAMLQEGTSKYSAKTIAEMVDYYGAFLNTDITQDYASLEIHSLNKHLSNVLPVIQEILRDSVFPQKEWDIYIQNKKQSYIVNNQKVSFVCRKKFAELIFGNTHPYGYNIQEQDYDKLKREDTYNFYKTSYTAKDAIIIVSGKVTDANLQLLDTYFGSIPSSMIETKNLVSESLKDIKGTGPHLVEMKQAVQSALRIGRLLFTRSHPDYCGMQVVNTILGGYFGSRLMANIREDKGYTYGIGSGLISFKQAGYFNISTEVGVDVTKGAIKEIYFEMERMQTEKVSQSELDLVRNYMLGTFLRSMDGPFALADRFKAIYFAGLGYDYYDRFVDTVRSITSQQILDLSNKYLNRSDMTELVVGGFGK